LTRLFLIHIHVYFTAVNTSEKLKTRDILLLSCSVLFNHYKEFFFKKTRVFVLHRMLRKLWHLVNCFLFNVCWGMYFIMCFLLGCLQSSVFDVSNTVICIIHYKFFNAWYFIPGTIGGSRWGISLFFSAGYNRVSTKENTASKPHTEPVHNAQSFSLIHLREVLVDTFASWFNMSCGYIYIYVLWFLQPPSVLRPLESNSDTETVEITVTKLLVKSYYDIVRKNVEDLVPKAIMHFLVCYILFLGFAKSFFN